MTDTISPIAQVNALKSAHAQRILARVADLKAELNAEADLWFGGKPPAFEELERFLDHRADNMRKVFGLSAEGGAQ